MGGHSNCLATWTFWPIISNWTGRVYGRQGCSRILWQVLVGQTQNTSLGVWSMAMPTPTNGNSVRKSDPDLLPSLVESEHLTMEHQVVTCHEPDGIWLTGSENWMCTAVFHHQMEMGCLRLCPSKSARDCKEHRRRLRPPLYLLLILSCLFPSRNLWYLGEFSPLLVNRGRECMGRFTDVFSSLLAPARGERWLCYSPEGSRGEKSSQGAKLWAVHLVVHFICKERRLHMWIYNYSWAMLKRFARRSRFRKKWYWKNGGKEV